MNRRGLWVATRIVLVGAVSVGGFMLAQEPSRRLESHGAVSLLRLAGAENVFVSGTAIQVVPRDHPAFRALVTPACSSVASILAIGCLASLVYRRSKARRAAALLAAAATVAAGNVLRIAGSVAVGLLAGRSSLVLFHDWVGSIFGFGYVLGGYVLLLYLLLPSVSPEGRPWHPSPRSSLLPSAAASS